MDNSAEVFAKVFHLSPDAVTISRLADGVILAVNEAYTSITGYAAEEVLGESSVSPKVSNWYNPSDRLLLINGLRGTGEVQNMQANFRRKDGELLIGLVSAKILDIEGSPCLLAVIRNITELVHLQDQLAESHHDFETVFENSADAILVSELDGRIVSANTTACQSLGYTLAELQAMRVSEINAPETLADVRAKIELLQRDGRLLSLVTHLTKDGRHIPTEVNSRIVEFQGGQRVLTIARDVSGRLGTEAALLDSERRYRLIFENSGTSNSIFDLDCRLVLQNSESRKTLGVEPDALGRTVEEIFGATQGGLIRRRMLEVQQSKLGITHESTFTLPDGERTFQSSYQPVLDDRGLLIGIQVISRDVSEARRLDLRLRQTDRLEGIGVLAGGIAHDFNNLLAGLSGNLELAQMNLKAGKPEVALDRLEKAAQVFQRAKSLTRQLLTFAKGGAPNPQPQMLNQQLKEWAEFSFSGSEVSILLDLQEDLWLCECDAMQIGQAVDNLLINARQASPDTGSVVLKAENCLRDRPYLAIHVTDQGPGVPVELREKIFDPFFTTKASGSGLGLASALSIARQHGGWIEVSSPSGRGSTFSLFLPATPGPKGLQKLEAKVRYQGSGTILLMDDEESLREAVAEILRTLGFDVVPVSDGLEALRMFQTERERGVNFRLALLDLTIRGGLNGVATASGLRGLDPTLPLLAMSGYSEDYYPETLALSGFDSLLAKPFTLNELATAIRAIVPSD